MRWHRPKTTLLGPWRSELGFEVLADLVEQRRVALGDVAQLEVVRHPRNKAVRIAPRAPPHPAHVAPEHREVARRLAVRHVGRHRQVRFKFMLQHLAARLRAGEHPHG